ncbi:hypothetical protein AA21952_1158 [Acetobacter oeni LMG 21952]|nr:hypothetical protein AA21952_1158 [Acetobacter oeni LMG 21952]
MFKHPASGGGVFRLAAMGGAGEGEFLIAETVMVGGTGFDEGKRLEGFGGGAWVDRCFGIAQGEHDAAGVVDDGDGAVMERFHAPAAQDFGERDIGFG